MKKILKIIGYIILAIVAALVIAWYGFLKPDPPAISDADRARLNVMPLPSLVRLKEEDLDISSGITLVTTIEDIDNDFLNDQLNYYVGNKGAVDLHIKCQKWNSVYPKLEIDESYTLEITDKIEIEAENSLGIIRALETLEQIQITEGSKTIVPKGRIMDAPRYPWRGLLVDVCRHWIDKDAMFRILDGMVASKLNVLHWHLTEYQAFRIESMRFPKLHKLGSNGRYYIQNDVKEIIQYAAERGIRIVPEFDVPGHTTSWFVGYPELASAPGPYTLDTIYGILEPVMDPTKQEVYDFLDHFFEEMALLFPDEYIHIGGDEVKTEHWKENEDIQRYMKSNRLDDAHALQAHFNIRLQKILEKHGKKMAGWDEIIHPDLPKDGIAVQAWRNQESLWHSARAGNKALLSAGYYLDHKQPAGFIYGVDPEVIEGAVTIEIDPTSWRAWDISMNAQGTDLEGQMYLFGEGSLRDGIFEMMGTTNSFTGAEISPESLAFTAKTGFGDIEHSYQIKQDSIIGTASLSFIDIAVKGSRIGGTDMESGIEFPDFKKIEPLTELEAANILGGEACMWSEMVDALTAESRIFPRAAVVAEKLWSPKELTTDTKDMYRRLTFFDDRIQKKGIRHNSYRSVILNDIIEPEGYNALMELVQVLSEDLLFNRMAIYPNGLSVNDPLNRIVDAAPAESMEAYWFGQDVELWLEENDSSAKKRIDEKLSSWATLNQRLLPFVSKDERLEAIAPHISNISELSKMAIQVLGQTDAPKPDEAALNAFFDEANIAYDATLLAVAEDIQQLILGKLSQEDD